MSMGAIGWSVWVGKEEGVVGAGGAGSEIGGIDESPRGEGGVVGSATPKAGVLSGTGEVGWVESAGAGVSKGETGGIGEEGSSVGEAWSVGVEEILESAGGVGLGELGGGV